MTPRRIVSTLIALLSVLLLSFAAAPGAMAAPDVDAAASALRSGASVYVDPAAEGTLSSAEADQLAVQIRDTGLPVFIAVLPESAAAGSTVDAALVALNEAVGLSGVYAVVVGDQFRAGSTQGSASDLATAAFRSQQDAGTFAVLTEFVTLVDQRFGTGSSSSSSTGGGLVVLVFLIGVLVIGGLVILVLLRRTRARQAAELAAVRFTIDADITEYGERLGRFSIAEPGFDEDTRADVQRALDSYDRAKTAVARMGSPADAANVTSALEDGRFALACVDARLAGRQLPERRPPCFADPRHGPSVGDVLWAPPGLGEREVPLCAACRTSVETGGQPQGMLVPAAGGQQPYWQAGPEYGAYTRGYFSPFGGIMTGMLVGTVLGGMWSTPAMAAPLDGAGGGDAWGGGGGDFGGGGGFGGGDF